jgi:hypothetical protein
MTVPGVFIPAVKVSQPDGSVLFRPGKPVIVEELIGTAETARILGMSRRWVIAQCESGCFKSSHKPGRKTGSWWKIERSEVLARREMEHS